MLLALATGGALALCGTAQATDRSWSGGTASYTNAANWTGGIVPGAGDNTINDNGSNNVVLLRDGDPLWQHGDTLAGNADNTTGAYLQTGSTNNTGGGNWLRMGVGNNTYGSYILSNGVVNAGGRTQIGERGVGYLEIDGGTYNGNVNDGGANPGMVLGTGDSAGGNGTLVINGGTVNYTRETWIGQGSGTGSMFMNAGTLNVHDWVAIGRAGATGVLTMTNGTINKMDNGEYLVGTGGTGTMNQTNGVLNVNGRMRIGDGSQGYYNVGGGAVINVGGEFWIGQGGSGNGVVNFSGGAFTNNDWFAVGREGAQGTLNLSGGSITKQGGGNVTLGHNSPATATINQTGGSFRCANGETWIGENAAFAIWNISGGTATFGVVHIPQNGDAIGAVQLDGGIFTANEISAPNGGNGTFNFNGGTLRAGAASPTFMHNLAVAQVQAGGAVIDSQGFDIAISQNLLDNGGGGLTKNGSGQLTLTGANTYTGNTVISAGALATTTASTGAGNYTLANSTTLGVTVLSAGAQLNMGNATLASSTAATLNVDLGAFGNPSGSQAPVNVTGALAVNGTISINVADGLPQLGQFPLIKYGSKTGLGSFVLGSLPVGVTATLSNNISGSSIDLVITGVNQPRWDGLAGGTWDTGADTNWVNIGTGLPTTYSDPSPVVLNDSAAGTTTINLTTTVNPSGVTVNNSTLPYAIKGVGKISGATSLTKTGNGILVITNTGGNNYTGKTIISGGTLSVTSLANGGSASAIGAASASPTNLVLSGGTLAYFGPAVTINRGYSLQGVNTNSGITTVSNLTLSGIVTAVANDGFTKDGAARLAYTGVGSNQLSGASYEVQAGSVLLDGSAGGQTNTVAGYFGLNGVVSASGILTNTTLNCGDFYVGNRANVFGSAVIENGATINDNSWFILGDGSNSVASVTLNGGTVNVPNGRLFLCSAPGTTATLNINGGTINKNGDYYAIVNGGWNGTGARTGIVNQVAGTVGGGSETWIGDGGGPGGNDSLGIYNLSGGTLTVNNWMGVGRDGCHGVFNLSGSAILNKGGGGDMVIGRGGDNTIGTFNMSGGTLNKAAGNPLIVGQNSGHGLFIQSGGTLNVDSEYWLGVDNNTTDATNNISGTAVFNINNWFSQGRGGRAVVNFSGGAISKNGGGNFIIGDGGQGLFTQTGGALTINNEMWIGQAGSGVGQYDLSAGTLSVSNWLAIGRAGATGTLNISGGSVTKVGDSGTYLTVGSGGPGTINQTGGTITSTLSDTFIGEGGQPGIWNISGGSAVLAVVNLPVNSGANGTLNLNGGSFSATEIKSGNPGGTGTLNLNGGSLGALANNANFLHDVTTANVLAGGANINSGTNAIGIAQALLDGGGNGGLIKTGPGTLYLNGVNTYTGLTIVSNGVLGGTGTIAGSVRVIPGTTLAPGASIGTLTVGGDLNISGNLAIDINKSLSPSNDVTTVTGGLTNGGAGTVTVTNLGPAVSAGDKFTLFNKPIVNGGSLIVVGGGVTWTNRFAVDGSIVALTGAVSTTPVTLTNAFSGGNLTLTWPADHTGWSLQVQTNSRAVGLGTNWFTVAGSTATNSVTISTSQANPTVFYRLTYP